MKTLKCSIIIGMFAIAILLVLLNLNFNSIRLPGWLRGRLPPLVDELSFDGDSQNLEATKIVPTLEASIDGRTNVVWCASFLAAWNVMADQFKEPPLLKDALEVSLSLNKALDPRSYIPEEGLYVAAGWVHKGITDRIIEDLAQKFPAKAPPAFPGIQPEDFVAYAYLEANVKFSTPYLQNHIPLVFTDSKNVKTELSSFGIRSKDESDYLELRKKPKLLYQVWVENHNEENGGYEKLKECIIDLDCTSTPDQIILALVDPMPTLAETMASVEDKIKKAEKEFEHRGRHDGLGPTDVLLVPDMSWNIIHHFAGLEKQRFKNTKLKGWWIVVARQDISFRLDRSGAQLKSEARMRIRCVGRHYIFNRPFLLYMKKRDAKTPYFVMWVENAELLKKWKNDRKPQ